MSGGIVASVLRVAVFTELPLPFATLRADAVEHNIERFGARVASAGAELAPHAKTSMAPWLLERQLAAGAWGLTVANASQLAALADLPVPRFIITAPVLDAPSLALLDGHEVLVFADSAEAVERMPGLGVLIEIGYPGGRTGCRTADDVERVLNAADGRVRGVAAFEGTLSDRAAVRALLADVARAFERLDAPDAIVSAGGSVWFDEVLDVLGGLPLVLRSGCYVTHDHGFYDDASPLGGQLRGALEVWGAVLSRPEPGLALVGVGKREVSFDLGLPVPLQRWSADALTPVQAATVTLLNDHHAYVAVEEDWRVGDVIGFGISHPCTTFDRWREIAVVDAAYDVLEMAGTRFS
jgi:D-serine deaminase-like pyridoxal phosphate-dependent protein